MHPINRGIRHIPIRNLTKLAVEKLFDNNFGLEDIEVLSCGTTTPDQLLPAHAAMVHGALGGHSVEINSTTGACSAGIQALKFGYLVCVVRNGIQRCLYWLRKIFNLDAGQIF